MVMKLEDIESQVIDEFNRRIAKCEVKRNKKVSLKEVSIKLEGVYDMGFLNDRDCEKNIHSLDLSYRLDSNCSTDFCRAIVRITWDYPGRQRLAGIKNVRYSSLF